MHPIKSLGFLVLSAISSVAIKIEFEYYPDGDSSCSSSTLSANIIAEDGECHNLTNPAESFHIGGPSSSDQVTGGCTITGYDSLDCIGSVGLIILGPSSGAACYTSGIFRGNQAKVESVAYTC
ncbi:hypothetical protein GQ53DRAFT_740752 [Thozetella sp. PMI_491]|nr:hypothetical protein GQ53DRAFT_740752 [Thozetella sp. PMI_491]